MDIEGQCAFESFIRLEKHAPAIFYHRTLELLSHLPSFWVRGWHDEAPTRLLALTHVSHLDRISSVGATS